jgi:hypothetical protein
VLLLAITTLLATLLGVLVERRWAESAQRLSSRLLEAIVFLLLPVIIFFTVIHLKVTPSIGAGLGFGWIERLVVFSLAWLIGSKVLKLARPETGAVMTTASLANTGYLGIPLVGLMLGKDKIGLAVTYDTVVNAPAVVLLGFGIGAAFGTKAGRSASDRVKAFIVRNPPLYALILALVLPSSVAPSWGADLAHLLALGIAPLGFFALGVNLMLEHEETGVRIFPPQLSAPVLTAVGLRCLVAPATVALLSATVIGVPTTFLVEAAMASGINSLVVAHIYGLDMRITVGAITWSTALVIAVAAAIELLGGF